MCWLVEWYRVQCHTWEGHVPGQSYTRQDTLPLFWGRSWEVQRHYFLNLQTVHIKGMQRNFNIVRGVCCGPLTAFSGPETGCHQRLMPPSGRQLRRQPEIAVDLKALPNYILMLFLLWVNLSTANLPPPSTPSATGHNPAHTTAADPLEEPPETLLML